MANNENLSNSIWTNGIKTDSEGYAIFYPLGTNKISVPSTTEEWPAGDKLISPFVYQDDKLVGFCDTKAMTVSGQTSITLNYEHIEADFSSIEEGMLTITAPNATITKYIWANSSSSDTGNSGDTVVLGTKYLGCKTVDEVKAVDPDYLTNDIVDGAWTQSLADLSDGNPSGSSATGMFTNAINLITFDSDLSSLTSAVGMFHKCTNLKSFNANLSSLVNGLAMFDSCSLVTFNSNLSALESADWMFNLCKLDEKSLKNIIDTIKPGTGQNTIRIGLGCDATPEDTNLFAQAMGYESIDYVVEAFIAKGWYINASCNGRHYTTYNLKPQVSSGRLPIYAKIEETDDFANYISVDESKKYRLDCFHITNYSTDGYIQFGTLEEAVEYFNIKPIERN